MYFSQKPASDYYNSLNIAETYLVEGKLDSSLLQYESTLKEHNYPFCRDIEQALCVALYTNNYESFCLLIKKAIKRGMTKESYIFFRKRWLSNNQKLPIDFPNYDVRHINYLQTIDTLRMLQFIELDVERDFLIKKLNKNKISKSDYFNKMDSLVNKYIKLVTLSGYPSENETGSYFSYNTKKKRKRKGNKGIFYQLPLLEEDKINHINMYIKITPSRHNTISKKPGNWLLTHYINNKDHSLLDSSLFKVIENGWELLKLDPLLIISALESTRNPKNEFALSYYSRLWAYELAFNYQKKFDLPEDIKQQINQNRATYFLRSLKQEEDLLKALYNLETNKIIDYKITSKQIKEVWYLKKLFFNYF